MHVVPYQCKAYVPILISSWKINLSKRFVSFSILINISFFISCPKNGTLYGILGLKNFSNFELTGRMLVIFRL